LIIVYRPNIKRTMKIADERKKKVVLKKSEPRIGNQEGQNGDVHPTAKTIDAMERRRIARIQRPRLESLSSIFSTTDT
jgi:hypothetical protein